MAIPYIKITLQTFYQRRNAHEEKPVDVCNTRAAGAWQFGDVVRASTGGQRLPTSLPAVRLLPDAVPAVIRETKNPTEKQMPFQWDFILVGKKFSEFNAGVEKLIA